MSVKDRAFRIIAIVVAAGLAATVATVLVVRLLPDNGGSPASRDATPTASTQLGWFVNATHGPSVSGADLRQHLTSALIDQFGGSDHLAAALAQLGHLTLLSSRPTGEPSGVSALLSSTDPAGSTTHYVAGLSVDRTGLVDTLNWAPIARVPTRWAAVDHRLRSLAPQVSFAIDRIDPDGRCHLVHGLQPDTPRPLGSAFKLYVLGALAKKVADRHARWDQRLAIRDAWKSYPSGTLQDRPAGTRLTLRDFADRMISVSDNTAADHLLHFVGRAAVERQLRLFDNTHPQLDTPFLTTREVFTMKGIDYPRLANRYLDAPAHRLRTLHLVDQVPRSGLTAWTEPRDVSSLEWFASPTDMCHAYAGLLRQSRDPRLGEVGHALSLAEGSLLLNSADYPMTWYKGGSEPGVDTENYLVRAADGTVLVASAMLSDPHAYLDLDPVFPQLRAIFRGALALADPQVGSTG